MGYNEDFIDQISQLSPSDNVTDENFNTPIAELQHNIKFLANLISNYNISSQTGNLLNNDGAGTQISQNGGTFNTFETKNSWLAVQNNVVANDSVIQSDLPIDAIVWTGNAGTVQPSGVATTGTSGIIGNIPSWIEREFFISPQLRGMELTFAIKGTGCITDQPYLVDGQIPYVETQLAGVYDLETVTSQPSASPSLARYEDVLIEIIGSNLTTPVAVKLGPWPNHKHFSKNPLWKPEYRTQIVNFTVPESTSSIKIKIYRTLSTGCVLFTNMFLGSIPRPYSGWQFKDIDINELYDFFNGMVKLQSSTLLGHHLADSKTNSLLSNVLTKQQIIHMQQFDKSIDEYDWDQISGPRQVELDNENVATPKLSIFEFDPGFTRYLHFNMKVNGPNPGLVSMGVSYFVIENEFSDTITCNISGDNITNQAPCELDRTLCNNIKFDVYYKVINPGDDGNPDLSTYTKKQYIIEVPKYAVGKKLAYFEISNEFFKDLSEVYKGSIVYFIISRDGSSELDTFKGNFDLASVRISIADPMDGDPCAVTTKYEIITPC